MQCSLLNAQEFVKLLDAEDRIIEYNQENLRLKSFTGKPSLIRSFPSKNADGALNSEFSYPSSYNAIV